MDRYAKHGYAVEPDYIEKSPAPTGDSKVGACAPLMVEMERPEIVDAAGLRVDQFGYAWNIGSGEPAAQFTTRGEVYGAWRARHCIGARCWMRLVFSTMRILAFMKMSTWRGALIEKDGKRSLCRMPACITFTGQAW